MRARLRSLMLGSASLGAASLVGASLACSAPTRSTSPDADASTAMTAVSAAAILGLARGDTAVFVLARAEQQRTEPIVTLDLQCPGVHWQTTLRDTLVLRADGTARRAFAIERLRDGVAFDASRLTAIGTWTTNTRTDLAYFSAAPSIVVHVTSEGVANAAPYDLLMRTAGAAALTNLSGMGGSCGTNADGREAEWTYTRR